MTNTRAPTSAPGANQQQRTATQPTSPLRTRAALKRELLRTIPQGAEKAYLERSAAALTCAQERLSALREERVKLRRAISIRERKLRDWKGKVPRTHEPTQQDVARELERCGEMPLARIGLFDGRCRAITVHAAYARALTGLDGFDKAWLIVAVPCGDDCVDGGACWPRVTVRGKDGQEQWMRVILQLVSVIRCDVKNALVEVEGLDLQGCGAEDAVVIDIKPYLSYCEAWPDDADSDRAASMSLGKS